MNTKELSILKLVDSIENTNRKIEQQFKILEEIKIYVIKRHALATSILKKNRQSILVILNKLDYIKTGIENHIIRQGTLKSLEVINKELSQLKVMIEKVNKIQLELAKYLKKIIGE